jgi:predicted DNA-binding protein YlxM (UPF0122 family)
MSENLKTIRELAEELDVSKQAIQYHIKHLTNKNRQTNDKGIVVLSAEEQRFIKSRVDKQTNKPANDKQRDKETKLDINNYLLSELEEVKKNRDKQLAVKDKQIENKDSQISQMQNLLDQQQRLALQDKQLLEEYKAEIKELESLTVAPHDDGEKEVAAHKQPEPENSTPDSQPKPKKWWRFRR